MTALESSTKVQLGGTRGGPDTPTVRQDRWWIQPVLTVSVLTAFVIYSTWAAFQNKNYFVGASMGRDLISPFYSPCIGGSCVPGAKFAFAWNAWTISPALLILIFPLGFRLTCYYYRRSYYRAFWWSPPACAVADAHGSYSGESRFPLIMQNAHRYFFYAGLIFNGLLTYDAVLAFHQPGIGWGVTRGHHRARGERHVVVALLPVVSRLSPPVRRSSEELQGPPVALQVLEVRHASQRQAHELRLGVSGLCRLHRYLHSSRGLWRHHRLPTLLRTQRERNTTNTTSTTC